jgi:hypothetical protein
VTLLLSALLCALAGFGYARERRHQQAARLAAQHLTDSQNELTRTRAALARERHTTDRLQTRLAASHAECAVAHARERARQDAHREAAEQARRAAALDAERRAQDHADGERFALYLEDLVRDVCANVGLNRHLITRGFDLSATGKTHEVLHYMADRLQASNPVRTVADVIRVFGGRVDAA